MHMLSLFVSVFAESPFSNPFSNLNLECSFKNSNLNHDVALFKHHSNTPVSFLIKYQSVSQRSWLWHISPANLCSFHRIANCFLGILIICHPWDIPTSFPLGFPSLPPTPTIYLAVFWPFLTPQMADHLLMDDPLTIHSKLGLIISTWDSIFFSFYH